MSEWVSEWVSIVECQLGNFSAIPWWEQVDFQLNDDEIRFVPDQHTTLDFHSASGQKCHLTRTYYSDSERAAVIVWISNYLCNQCLSPLIFWVRISIKARCTRLCDKVCQWLTTPRWFSPGRPVSYTNKTDRHDITEIALKVALRNIKRTNNVF